MAFDENGGNGMYMPVAPAYSGNNNGGFGGDWGWIILLLLLAGNGWGMGGFGGFGGMMGLGYDFPWLMNGQQNVLSGVNANTDAAVNQLATQTAFGNIQNALTTGFGDVQNTLCNGFAGVNATVNGAQNAISAQLYNNEIANLNRSFAEQTANAQGFNGVQSSLCDIRYGNATNTRDILTALTAGVQSIKDQLCQDKIDAKNDEISQLRQEVLYARGQASQDVQTARLLAGQTSETDAIYNRLSQCPVPCMPVYGMTPIFTCNNGNNGCGCNGGFIN